MGGFLPGVRGPASTITGYRDPDGTVTQRVKLDVQDEILLYVPSANPFCVLTKHLRARRTVENYTYDWLEKDVMPREVTVSGAQTAVDTAIELVAGHGGRVMKFALLKHPLSGELIWVTAIATDTLTVTRAIGGGGKTMDDGDTLLILGTAFEDGSGRGNLKSTKEDRQFNYTQELRTAYGFSGRQMKTGMFGGRDPVTERKAQQVEHTMSMEYCFLLGKRHKLTGPGGLPVTFTGGVEYFTKTNLWDCGGNRPKEGQFVEFLESVMQFGLGGNLKGGTQTKYLFCSSRLQTIIESWGREKIQYRPHDTILGLVLGEYQTAVGRVIIVRDPILTGAVYGGYGVLVDLNHVRYVAFNDRDSKLYEEIQANDVDALEEEWRSDFGAQIELEAAHGIIKGVPTT